LFGPYTVQWVNWYDPLPPGPPSTPTTSFFYNAFPFAYKQKPFYTEYQWLDAYPPWLDDGEYQRKHHTPYEVIENNLDFYPWIHCSNTRHVVQGFGFAKKADPTDKDGKRRVYIDANDVSGDLVKEIGAKDLMDVQAIYIDVPKRLIMSLT
jgi:hypothetical protein